jgi:hypothetical protein
MMMPVMSVLSVPQEANWNSSNWNSMGRYHRRPQAQNHFSPAPRGVTGRQQFSEKEVADLTLAIATINAWNRLAISARTVPGTYQVPKIRLKTGT